MQSSAHVQSALMHKLTLQSATRISDTGPTASGFPSKAQALLPLTLQVIHAITNQEPFELGKDAQKEITCWQSKNTTQKDEMQVSLVSVVPSCAHTARR